MAVVKMAGFTFLEIMVSVTILGVALVTLIGSQSQSISLAGFARVETTVSLLARQKMTELVTGDFAELSTTTGDFGDTFPGYTWRAEVTDLNEDETGLENTNDLLKRVHLVVSEPGKMDEAFSLDRIVMAVLEENQGP